MASPCDIPGLQKVLTRHLVYTLVIPQWVWQTGLLTGVSFERFVTVVVPLRRREDEGVHWLVYAARDMRGSLDDRAILLCMADLFAL